MINIITISFPSNCIKLDYSFYFNLRLQLFSVELSWHNAAVMLNELDNELFVFY